MILGIDGVESTTLEQIDVTLAQHSPQNGELLVVSYDARRAVTPATRKGAQVRAGATSGACACVAFAS